MSDILLKLRNNPWGLVKRALYKTIIGPFKYGKGDDYYAFRYWHDRLSKYGASIVGVGDEGLSEKENESSYGEDIKVFLDVCRREGIDFNSVAVLEIGCGNGMYTRELHALGVKQYTGIDITDVLFNRLTRQFDQFGFVRKDISEDKIEGKFDLIAMISVIEHIVNDKKLDFAVENIKECLSDKGVLIVGPVTAVNKRHLFYMKSWSLENMKKRFSGYTSGKPVPFRRDFLMTIRKSL